MAKMNATGPYVVNKIWEQHLLNKYSSVPYPPTGTEKRNFCKPKSLGTLIESLGSSPLLWRMNYSPFQAPNKQKS
jgi:hypothetical protein